MLLILKDVLNGSEKLAFDKKVAGWFLRVSVLFLVALIFALAGPFGTYEAGGFGDRLVYWLVLVFVSVLMAIAIKAFAEKYLKLWSFLARESVVVLAMTAMFSPFLQYWSKIGFPGTAISPPSFWLFASEVLVICASISVIVHGVPLIIRNNLEATQDASKPRLVSRLPDTFTGQILRLSVKGHIVIVVTDEGPFELRMRFADAVEEMSELTGFCTHRSHWVTQASICEVLTQNGRPVLLLCNGDEVPVSRKYQPNLADAGFL